MNKSRPKGRRVKCPRCARRF
ncbi:MAG: hypothetical protein LBL66_07555 [Clostridiales bacterium]|nr:hypothetical protein [Clostridiales bacterium]